MRIDRPRLVQLNQEIVVLESWNLSLARETPVRLVKVRRLLIDGGRPPRAALVAALDVYRQVLSAETKAQEELLARVYGDARLELGLAGGSLAALAALAGLGFFLFRHRLFAPLADLGRLLSSVAGGERREIDVRDSGPLLGPLFKNYNALVRRLGELEAVYRARTRSLESEVQVATRELLRQRQSLVRAELLAAVGETAASLAHELRNPLAGIRMSLSNLRRETDDADHCERLQRAGEELKQVGRTVDRLLDAARHTPEGRRRIQLATVVGELAALLRHQLPADVTLAVDVAEDLHASLPEDGFRQALLNLILNAARAS